MQKKLFLIAFLVTICLISVKAFKAFTNSKIKKSTTTTRKIKLNKIATNLKAYTIKNGMDTNYCFVINMAIPSGKPRFFVYNLKTDSIEKNGLVTHGSGSETSTGKLVFKNIPNSLASAKGKYKIGNSYYGKFGLAYKLHGLESSNSKAFERFIVLHSHDCVPEYSVYPQPICVSWGCPTVAPSFLKTLQKIIDKSNKPILLDLGYWE
jgi:hypothetical protein